jgi:Arc/MetJ-type ribon-helix-helix transcriptional regulator
MNIDIAPETERIVREELSSGHFKSVDELILSSVQAWRERNLTPPHRARAAGIDKAREFVAWAKSHPATPPLSDDAISRASLNPDRW